MVSVAAGAGDWSGYEGYIDNVLVDADIKATYLTEPRIINVTKSNGYNYIQDTVNAASPGDTINVLAGEYREDIVINKALNLTGAGVNDSLLYGAGVGPIIKVTATANISGFTIQNSPGAGIRVEVNGCNIHNNLITGNKNYGIYVYSEGIKNTIINKNSICNNIPYDGYVSNNGSMGLEIIDFTNNWWGNPLGGGGHVYNGLSSKPWLLVEDGETYDRTIALNAGWTIISCDKELENWDVAGTSGLMYVYDNGAFSEVINLDPITPVFVKSDNAGGIGFNYKPDQQGIYTTNLEAGWNLISIPETAASSDDIFSPLMYGSNNEIALTTIVCQGQYNAVAQASFYQSMLTTYDVPDLNPLNGYWVYLNVPKIYGVIVVE